jgi:hypothetical protein
MGYLADRGKTLHNGEVVAKVLIKKSNGGKLTEKSNGRKE